MYRNYIQLIKHYIVSKHLSRSNVNRFNVQNMTSFFSGLKKKRFFQT
jgi:hypothetical protein